jgi:hypothetical protein
MYPENGSYCLSLISPFIHTHFADAITLFYLIEAYHTEDSANHSAQPNIFLRSEHIHFSKALIERENATNTPK